ncbi:OmpA family protein [Flavobacterium sp.]|uniref:OmpA family protein n=1 Tax=Flavobacterium sp. TaxID=239 RepID=UPI0037519D1E
MRKLFLLFIVLFNYTLVKAQEQFVVYFDSNKHEVNNIENRKLQDWISLNKDSKIVAINGFTDEDGSNGFNDTLAKKRVDFIFNQIKDKLKIREDFKTRSFGENFNQSTDKSLNRKVTIYYILLKDLAREDEILGIKKEVVIQPKKEIKYPEKLIFDNPNGTTSEYVLDREFMKKVGEAQVGEKLKMDNLNFRINTFIVNPESRGKMFELLLVLQKNPNLKVEIHGHLCCQPIDRVDLSTQRAKAIYNFLVNNDIDKTRLSYKGFGSTIPIYALPEKDETQRAANRRVEILIVSN